MQSNLLFVSGLTMKKYIVLAISILIFSLGVKSQVTTSPAPQWVKDIVDPDKELKWYNWRDTFAIVSTHMVEDSLYDITIEKVDMMIGHRNDILGQLKANNHILLLIGEGEETSDFQCYAPFPDTYGYGATLTIPVSSVKAINLFWEDGSGIYREDILIHEFAHGIHLCGLNNTDFDTRLQNIYDSNKSKWINTYAYTNKEEYWAELTQSYFDCNYEGPSGGDGVHNNIDTRDELYVYDQSGYDLCVSIYGRLESDLPGKAINPYPVNESDNVDKNIILSWSAGKWSTSHDVYFSKSNPPEKITNQADNSYNPGQLDINTTYYWRIDGINALGATEGNIWSFTTDATTNVNLIMNGVKVKVYPNPVVDNLSIYSNSTELMHVSLYSFSGNCVFSDFFTNSISIDSSVFNPGIYVIEIHKGNEYTRDKIIIL